MNPDHERLAAQYPALKHLARAYLHQDYDLEYATPADAVDDFLSGSPDQAPQLVTEIERALAEFASEEETKVFVVDALDSYYQCDKDGLTYRDWLASVADRAREAGF
ncbi:MAG: contact-dependent growth inhibition system immunity protein [Nocardioides sp.]